MFWIICGDHNSQSTFPLLIILLQGAGIVLPLHYTARKIELAGTPLMKDEQITRPGLNSGIFHLLILNPA